MASRKKRVLFLDGPGNLIGVYRAWKRGETFSAETAATYSGQFFDIARRLDVRVHAVAWPGERKRLEDGDFVVEHRPRAVGYSYHVGQMVWAAELSRLALGFRPDVVVLCDSQYLFPLAPLRAAGCRFVAALHNTLWPINNPPSGPANRMLLGADAWFLGRHCETTLALSPECERQVRSVAPRARGPIVQYRPKFFGRIGKPGPRRAGRPFHTLFASRVERNKGVFDLLDVAADLQARRPGQFRWVICGGGSAVEEVARVVAERELRDVVELRGRLARPELQAQYVRCDAVIVPTTSCFNEGMAKTALEATLAGRPAIVSDVVPAGEILGDAVVVVPAGDVAGYARAVERLADDELRYRSMCQAADAVSSELLLPDTTFETVLERTLRRVLGSGEERRVRPTQELRPPLTLG